MKAIVDFCIVPIGVGVSVSKYIAACQLIFKEAGLKTNMHAYGTNIEGDWDTVFEAIKQCHETVHEMDVAITNLAEKLALSNPDSMRGLKEIMWEGTEHWDELLMKRAEVSGTRVLSDFTRKTLEELNKN